MLADAENMLNAARAMAGTVKRENIWKPPEETEAIRSLFSKRGVDDRDDDVDDNSLWFLVPGRAKVVNNAASSRSPPTETKGSV